MICPSFVTSPPRSLGSRSRLLHTKSPINVVIVKSIARQGSVALSELAREIVLSVLDNSAFVYHVNDGPVEPTRRRETGHALHRKDLAEIESVRLHLKLRTRRFLYDIWTSAFRVTASVRTEQPLSFTSECQLTCEALFLYPLVHSSR